MTIKHLPRRLAVLAATASLLAACGSETAPILSPPPGGHGALSVPPGLATPPGVTPPGGVTQPGVTPPGTPP